MISHTASTRQPPAGGPGSTAHLDALLQELRRGERAGFLSYFQLFRSPVYDFAHRLLRDETAAVAATTEAFVVGFRQVILDGSDTDLRVLTWRCALDACSEQAGARADEGLRTDPARAHESPRAHRLHKPGGPGRRFEAALEALDLRRRAVLLLHDVHGLSVAETAAVFAIAEEAAGTLLFRAREQFRQAFDVRTTDLSGGSCRLAERAVAGAVGLGLGEEEVRRLRRHAGYCRPCRAVMKTWGEGPVGLAVFLEPAPLPRALSTPVFPGAVESALVPVPVGMSVLGRSLGRVGRAVRSRTAAYVVAAACLALAGGVAAREEGVRQFILVQSAGPTIRLVTQPPAEVRPSAQADARASARPSSSSSPAAIGLAADSPVTAASPATVQPSSGSDAAGSAAGRLATVAETGPGQVSAGSAPAAGGAAAARAAAAAAGDKAAGNGQAKATGNGQAKATGNGQAKAAGKRHAQAAGKRQAKAAGKRHAKAAGKGHAKAAGKRHAKAAGKRQAKAGGHAHAKAAGNNGRARPAGSTRAARAGGRKASAGRASTSHGSSGKSHQARAHASDKSHGKKDH